MSFKRLGVSHIFVYFAKAQFAIGMFGRNARDPEIVLGVRAERACRAGSHGHELVGNAAGRIVPVHRRTGDHQRREPVGVPKLSSFGSIREGSVSEVCGGAVWIMLTLDDFNFVGAWVAE